MGRKSRLKRLRREAAPFEKELAELRPIDSIEKARRAKELSTKISDIEGVHLFQITPEENEFLSIATLENAKPEDIYISPGLMGGQENKDG